MTIYEYVCGDRFNSFIDNICHIPHYKEDLRHFIIEILLSKPEKYNKAIEDKWIDYIVIRIITNQWKSNTSPFYKQYRKFESEVSAEKAREVNYYLEVNSDSQSVDYLIELDDNETKVQNALHKLAPHYTVILSQWLGIGHEKQSVRQIAKKACMSPSTIYSHLVKAKGELIEILKTEITW